MIQRLLGLILLGFLFFFAKYNINQYRNKTQSGYITYKGFVLVIMGIIISILLILGKLKW